MTRGRDSNSSHLEMQRVMMLEKTMPGRNSERYHACICAQLTAQVEHLIAANDDVRDVIKLQPGMALQCTPFVHPATLHGPESECWRKKMRSMFTRHHGGAANVEATVGQQFFDGMGQERAGKKSKEDRVCTQI